MRAAIVLGKRADHALALHVILAALPGALEVGLGAVDAGAHLLDLRVERAALRRLAHENGQQAGRLAAEALELRLDAVEIALLLAERFFDAARPLGARGIGAGAVDRGELAFEPGADRISGRCGCGRPCAMATAGNPRSANATQAIRR